MLAEYPIQVIGPGDAIVVIFRGIERESYSCAPVCEKRITLGDSAPIFGANLSALGTFNSQMNPEQKNSRGACLWLAARKGRLRGRKPWPQQFDKALLIKTGRADRKAAGAE